MTTDLGILDYAQVTVVEVMRIARAEFKPSRLVLAG